MTLQAYATAAEFADYPVAGVGDRGLSETELGALLWRASRDVDRALVAAVYQVDDDGAATEASVIEALRFATCEQADWRIESGQSSGVSATGIHSYAIGRVQITRGYTGRGSSAESDRFSPQAYAILQAYGLTGQAPIVSAG